MNLWYCLLSLQVILLVWNKKLHPTFSLSRLSDMFRPLYCQRKKYSTLPLVTNSYSVSGKVKMQHLCWTALKFPILTLSLKGVAKLGRASALPAFFPTTSFKKRYKSYFLQCPTCIFSSLVPCVFKQNLAMCKQHYSYVCIQKGAWEQIVNPVSACCPYKMTQKWP